MIATLNGTVLFHTTDRVAVDVNGVGYEVLMSADGLARLPEAGESVFLHIHTNVREDAITLYGFAAAEEKELFLILRTVTGIGPKVALAMLSGLRVEPLCTAIVEGNVKLLTTLHGIGRKSAERLCVELKEKVSHLAGGAVSAATAPAAAGGSAGEDAVSALTNLGYSEPQAKSALAAVKREAGEAFSALAVEELIRLALRRLG